MESSSILFCFFKRAQADPRLSVAHIGIFSALVFYKNQRDLGDTFQAFSKEIMHIAKILSSSTYHKCILELKEYGYLGYKSSFSKRIASTIHLWVLNG